MRCFYCLGEHEYFQCLTHATDRTLSSQKEASEALARMGERTLVEMRKNTEETTAKLEEVQSAMGELHDFLIWAHSETIWRMEKEIQLLTGIHDMLKNPRATEADELYKMGADSFRRHRLVDALSLLEEAHKLNPGDYRILVTLGHTYVQSNELPEAASSFQAAAEYARTDEYKGMALLLVARAYRCLGKSPEAVQNAREASELIEGYWPAYYELAGCIAESLSGSKTVKKL